MGSSVGLNIPGTDLAKAFPRNVIPTAIWSSRGKRPPSRWETSRFFHPEAPGSQSIHGGNRLEPREQCFRIISVTSGFCFLYFFFFNTPQAGVSSKAGFAGAGRSKRLWKPQPAEPGGPGRAPEPAGRASARTALCASTLRPGVPCVTSLVKPVWLLEPQGKPLIWFRAGNYWLAPRGRPARRSLGVRRTGQRWPSTW